MTTPLAQWLKPPRSLLLILFLLTLVSVSALGWFGWSLLDQDRMVETQRVRERLERAADSVAAALRGTLADIGDRLSTASVQTPPMDGLLLILDERGITAAPAERLLYRPFVDARAEANGDLFEEGERLEFQEARPGSAAEIYRGLAGSKDAAVRAGALLRLARVSRADASVAYRQLAAIAGASVAGAPADSVARHALCELTGRRDEAEALQRDLLAARWPLTKGQFEFYWREATRMAGGEQPPPAQAAAFSDAAALVWQDRDAGPRGTRTVWVDGRPLFFIWRAAGGRKAVLVAEPPAVLKQACANEDVLCAVADNDGRMLAGRRAGAGHAVVRTAAESQLPWTLYVAAGSGATRPRACWRGSGFCCWQPRVMVVFLIAGTYFIARAIRSEAEVARMQSEFVSAVSHEFRSPLTSHAAAVGDPGAGARAQRRAPAGLLRDPGARDGAAATAGGSAAEFRAHGSRRAPVPFRGDGRRGAGAARGRRVRSSNWRARGGGSSCTGRETECRIEADPEAMSVALRNLVDNALKYSPEQPAVWVEWGARTGAWPSACAICGAGIPEPSARRFSASSCAAARPLAGNVKGSGVGLAMVRHIVAAHGGEIAVESEPGKGSTFTILLRAVEKA